MARNTTTSTATATATANGGSQRAQEADSSETSPLIQRPSQSQDRSYASTHSDGAGSSGSGNGSGSRSNAFTTHDDGDNNNDHENDVDGARDEENDKTTAATEPPSTKKLVAIMASLWVGCFFAALDTSVVATLTAPISSSFSSLSLLSWLATGYLIANSACQPLSGKLTDIFSRRIGLVFSNVFFAMGTLICGLAPDARTMIAGRVIAGVGGGGLTCISTFLTSDLVPLRQRGLWQGFGNLVYGLGMGSGGVFGGLLADRLSWRWAFLIQVPFIVLSTGLVWWLVDPNIPITSKRAAQGQLENGENGESQGRGAGKRSVTLRRIDFLGAVLLVVSLVLLLLGLNTGGNQLPWSHPLIVTSLVLSAVTLGLFFRVESSNPSSPGRKPSSPAIASSDAKTSPSWKLALSPPEPMIPVLLIARTRTVLAACLANWFGTMAAFLALYYVPLYLQVLGESSTLAGLRAIPFAVATSFGSLGCGYVMRSSGTYWCLNLTVLALFVAGSAALCTFDYRTDGPSPPFATPSWATYVSMVPLGFGYGAMLTTTFVAMISAVPHEYQAVITATSYAFRSTGSSIGITIASAVFQNILTRELQDRFGGLDGADDEIRKIRNSLDEIKRLPASWRGKEVQVREVYVHAIRGAFVAGLGLAVLALLSGACVKEHTLYKTLERRESEGADGRGRRTDEQDRRRETG